MAVESDVYTALTGNVTLAALISTRCYPVRLPDNATYPACVYTTIDDVQNASKGKMRSRVQIDCYASSYTSLKSVRDAVQGAIDGQLWSLVGWGSDVYDDIGAFYFQPVDIFIEH